MNLVSDYSGVANFAYGAAFAANLLDELDRFSTSLNATAQAAEELHHILQMINGKTGFLSIRPFNQNRREVKEGESEGTINTESVGISGQKESIKTRLSKQGERYAIPDMAQEVAKLGKSVLDAQELWGKLRDSVNSLDNVFGLLEQLNNGVNGLSGLASGARKCMSGSISSTTELEEGVIGIAGAETRLGPPGWIAAVITLAGAGMLDIGGKNENQQQEKEAQRKRASEMALQTFVMGENDAGNYMAYVDKFASHPIHKWQLPSATVYENIKKYEPDAYALSLKPPLPVTDETSHRYSLPPNVPRPVEHATTDRLSYLERTSGLEMNLMTAATDGRLSTFETTAVKALRVANQYDMAHHDNSADMVNSAIKASLISMLDPVNGSNEAYDRSPRDKNKRQSISENRTLEEDGRRVINISLNKAMIENFTINTRDLNDGINDFKHKVEQVLLEILNSANVIH